MVSQNEANKGNLAQKDDENKSPIGLIILSIILGITAIAGILFIIPSSRNKITEFWGKYISGPKKTDMLDVSKSDLSPKIVDGINNLRSITLSDQSR